MFCHKCGEQLAEGAVFCHNCGTEAIYEDKQNVAGPVQTIEQEHVDGSNRNDFKLFVDNHVRATTKFQSADDLLMNSKPLRFVWACIGIPSVIGLILGERNMEDSMGWLLGLLVFGGFFGYVAVFIASGIIRARYRLRFSGESEHEINTKELQVFLDEHLRQLSSDFYEWGYLDQQGLPAVIDNAVSKVLKGTTLCCEFGPKKKNLVTISIKPSIISPDSERMQYTVGAVRNGLMMDGRAAGFLGHTCLIRTAPILQAAIEYYLKNY